MPRLRGTAAGWPPSEYLVEETRTFVCTCCGEEVAVNPRLPPGTQEYCSKPKCQRARRNARHKIRMATDAKYREAHEKAQQAWLEKNPKYYSNYRKDHPESVLKNRLGQMVRDQRRRRRVQRNRPVHKASAGSPASLPSGYYVMKRVDGRSMPAFTVYVSHSSVLPSTEPTAAQDQLAACKDDRVL